MKHWCLIAVCALVAVSGAASDATAQYKAEFKNSLVVGPTGPWGEAAVKLARGTKAGRRRRPEVGPKLLRARRHDPCSHGVQQEVNP